MLYGSSPRGPGVTFNSFLTHNGNSSSTTLVSQLLESSSVIKIRSLRIPARTWSQRNCSLELPASLSSASFLQGSATRNSDVSLLCSRDRTLGAKMERWAATMASEKMLRKPGSSVPTSTSKGQRASGVEMELPSCNIPVPLLHLAKGSPVLHKRPTILYKQLS